MSFVKDTHGFVDNDLQASWLSLGAEGPGQPWLGTLAAFSTEEAELEDSTLKESLGHVVRLSLTELPNSNHTESDVYCQMTLPPSSMAQLESSTQRLSGTV